MTITLTWAAVPNAIYYNIYRGTSSGGPYKCLAQSNPNPGQTTSATNIVTTYTDGPNNLYNGIDYFYVVSAVTPDGESSYSAEMAALAPSQPVAPTGTSVVVA